MKGMGIQTYIHVGAADSSKVSSDLKISGQAVLRSNQGIDKLFSTNILVLVLVVISFSGVIESALVQPTGASSGRQLIEELKLLAQSDADNNIDRRTEFVIKLYEKNSMGLTAQDIRKAYDDAFSLQSRQNEQQTNTRGIGAGLLGLLALGAGTFVVAKKNILKVKTVKAQIPWVGEVEFETVENARKAAWKLYVEMRTRIVTQHLGDDQGLLREALNSLYKLFELTREILKEAGPDVGASRDSVGGIAIALLNEGLRPFTAKWHPKLKIWEAQKTEGMSDKEHEGNWSEEADMRRELKLLSQNLEQYTNALAKISGAPLLNSSAP
jgi:hypothetical protein